MISDPPRIQEPGGRRELAAFLRPVPHAAEGTAGHVLRGVTVPQRQRLRREVGSPPLAPRPQLSIANSIRNVFVHAVTRTFSFTAGQSSRETT